MYTNVITMLAVLQVTMTPLFLLCVSLPLIWATISSEDHDSKWPKFNCSS